MWLIVFVGGARLGIVSQTTILRIRTTWSEKNSNAELVLDVPASHQTAIISKLRRENRRSDPVEKMTECDDYSSLSNLLGILLFIDHESAVPLIRNGSRRRPSTEPYTIEFESGH